jgi:hypothetical protein
MKLKQYMQENTVKGFEVIENQIAISVILESGARHALDVDTSSIPNGTRLTVVENFSVDDGIITVAGITLNTEEVEITTPEERLEQLRNQR